MKIVIIAGGKGTRIASVSSDIPKAMIPINGKPILEYQIELAKRYGYGDFIFIIGYLGDQISAYFGNGSKWNIHIDYYKEIIPLGTAGALACLSDKLTTDFFLFYGDTIMNFDMKHMLDYHIKKCAHATLFLHPNDHPYDSDIVDLDKNGRVLHFYNKPHPEGFISHNIVNAALFIFSPKVLKYIKKGIKSHIEKDVLPACLNDGLNIYGYVSPEYIKDMGTPDRYIDVCNDVMSGKVAKLNRKYSSPAIFLDRDGTISKEVNLLCRPEQMELIDGAAEAIRYINQKGFLVIVVTNQPVIARNLCDFETLDKIHAKLETLLGAQHAYLNAIYFCPHHPDAGYPEERKEYKIKCNCRKPAPGMLLKAAKEWNIDMPNSFMIGDSLKDVEAGNNAKVGKSVLIEQNKPFALLKVIKNLI
jgi:mannose-1-phosphate guanylyltransferase / phosphomannomutase